MKRSRFSVEQIAYALRLAESGKAVADVCRQLEISDATFYVWKKKFGNLVATELRELRSPREWQFAPHRQNATARTADGA